jgi:hypothetical protein
MAGRAIRRRCEPQCTEGESLSLRLSRQITYRGWVGGHCVAMLCFGGGECSAHHRGRSQRQDGQECVPINRIAS